MDEDKRSGVRFHFDRVFTESCSQEQLFVECGIHSLINRCLEGYSSTVFAYGQVGCAGTVWLIVRSLAP